MWEGGLAIHGGLIVGPLVGLWVPRQIQLPLLPSLDIAAPSTAIAQAIGRWGNFFNEEAFGTPTDLSWKLYISPPNRPLGRWIGRFLIESIRVDSFWLGQFRVPQLASVAGLCISVVGVLYSRRRGPLKP